jgi:hypothetical protein
LEAIRYKQQREKRKRQGQQCRLFPIKTTITQYDAEEAPLNVKQFIESFGITDLTTIEILQQLRDGDLIDLNEYRGTGIWLFMKKLLYKSVGEYGE